METTDDSVTNETPPTSTTDADRLVMRLRFRQIPLLMTEPAFDAQAQADLDPDQLH
jgi:hypothetical protein